MRNLTAIMLGMQLTVFVGCVMLGHPIAAVLSGTVALIHSVQLAYEV